MWRQSQWSFTSSMHNYILFHNYRTPTQSVEIKKFWRNVPETDTSRPINIPHYTFKMTSINTCKTLLDKTKFHQRDVWHTLQWQYTLNIGTCRCWKSSIKSNSCFAINDLSYWLSLSSECLLSLLHRQTLLHTLYVARCSQLVFGQLCTMAETWAPNASDLQRLHRNDRAMIRWICGAKLADKIPTAVLHQKLDLVRDHGCSSHSAS